MENILKSQRIFFNSNKTKDIGFRIENLKKFKKVLRNNENLLYEAIYKDFGKSQFETYFSELSLVFHELNKFIRNIERWSKPKKVFTRIANFPGRSYIIPEPLGNTLVIGAWNYPYQLSLIPAISAIAAGNTVILKPSELPSNCSRVLAQIINANFEASYFHVIQGGVKETTELLIHRFDKIFFTGSPSVGKIIYQAAAKHLTPVTLELGGKSPNFVLADSNVALSAKRIVWAKFLNAGQTCVAPDYILVHQSIQQLLLEALKSEIEKHYQKTGDITENYTRIINEAHFDRLNNFIDPKKLYYGGNTNREKKFIGPTLLKDITFEDEVMKDEIFGPILPVISFSDLEEVIKEVKDRPKPLACYIYSKNKKKVNRLIKEISFGGGAVNDSLMHLANSNLPFGGVGHSGMGNYHGKYGFDTFSHYKSVLNKPLWLELPLKYAPYSKRKLKLIKWLLE